MARVLSLLLVLGFVGVVSAQINPTGPFVGAYSEGFEGPEIPKYQFLPHYDVFGGVGDLDKLGSGQGLHVTSGWAYYYTCYPYSGQYFMGPTYGVGAKWEFDVPAAAFGGYFTTIYQSSGATAYFYSAERELVGQMPVQAPAGNNTWVWDGWTFDVPIKYIEIWSNWGAGHIMQDDVQYTPIPEPASLALLAVALFLRRR